MLQHAAAQQIFTVGAWLLFAVCIILFFHELWYDKTFAVQQIYDAISQHHPCMHRSLKEGERVEGMWKGRSRNGNVEGLYWCLVPCAGYQVALNWKISLIWHVGVHTRCCCVLMDRYLTRQRRYVHVWEIVSALSSDFAYLCFRSSVHNLLL